MSKLTSPKVVTDIMRKYAFHFTKSLGQNFLIDENILNRIVDSADISAEDVVIEIGTGIGTLTYELCRRAKKVIAVEIDSALLPILSDTLRDCENVQIINEDILKLDMEMLKSLTENAKRIKVIANLPYYITSAIITRFLESELSVDTMVLMMQKEVGDRVTAVPNTKAYGSLSVFIQFYMQTQRVMRIPKTAFIPQPNVDSLLVKFSKKDQDLQPDLIDRDLFFDIVRGSFSRRRKTILNSLSSSMTKFDKQIVEYALEQSNIDKNRRGETLSVQEFVALSNAMHQIITNS